MTPQDVYSKKATVVGLAAQAGLLKGYQVDAERERLLAAALGRLFLLNSRRWITFMQKILPEIRSRKGSLGYSLNGGERTMLTMLHYTLWGKGLSDLYSAEQLWRSHLLSFRVGSMTLRETTSFAEY